MSVFLNITISKVRSFSITPSKRFAGMITPNEYSTVKWKSLHKLFKVGTEEIVMVLRVDTEKGENIWNYAHTDPLSIQVILIFPKRESFPNKSTKQERDIEKPSWSTISSGTSLIKPVSILKSSTKKSAGLCTKSSTMLMMLSECLWSK